MRIKAYFLRFIALVFIVLLGFSACKKFSKNLKILKTIPPNKIALKPTPLWI